MIQTLDSLETAVLIDKQCQEIGKIMPLLIEVNVAKEEQKTGVMSEDLEGFVKSTTAFKNIKLMGLMTMGPLVEDEEQLRPHFRLTRRLFDNIKNIYGDRLDWKYLSMGMSLGFRIAIEEGANIIRIGTKLFGERPQSA